MYKCRLPEDHNLEHLDSAFDRLNPKDPVVVMLDTDKLKIHIEKFQLGEYISGGSRMNRIEEMLDKSIFVLPIILFNDIGIRVVDGRHRVTALWHRFEPEIPFITARAMHSEVILKLGSSKKIENFDFTEVPYDVIQ